MAQNRRQPQPTQDIWCDYQILDEIARDENASQRDLARRAGVALGRTNQVIKRLIRKGLVKTRQINAKRVAYYLTPKGFSEKLHLVVRYAQITINLFSCMREVINHQLGRLQEEVRVQTVVIFGTGELAEAAYLSIQEMGLDLVGVYDRADGPTRWLGREVLNLITPPPVVADVVMITDMEDITADQETISQLGREIIEVRQLLSDQLAAFARRVAEDQPRKGRS